MRENAPDAREKKTLTKQELRRFLGGAEPNIILLESIDSTNKEAKRMVAGAASGRKDEPSGGAAASGGAGGNIPFGTVIIADEQTEGHGRKGRPFLSRSLNSDSLYMSFILKPSEQILQTQFVTIMAAVAVCETIEELTGAEESLARDASAPRIKWVNDIFIGGKKVCGILTEAVMNTESGGIAGIVLGIGVNINVPQEDFPDHIRKIAGSVKIDTRKRGEFAATLMRKTLSMYEGLEQGVSPIDAYRARSLMAGRDITVIGADGSETPARAESISDDGSLLVRYADGTTEALRSGEVSLRLN
ncbi:MAG: biotin--[acetyl-CoA-carboxylase] ligase [Clostridiales Family XIII bacterium]|jgi:BirA family biotin operon repressor/biotin-[acetyl-CoA-carboxylase] ligase|nr:biotin--[acetyl-CoA-carboxylase] ligase [Clostridiales Family XIII bacterium]